MNTPQSGTSARAVGRARPRCSLNEPRLADEARMHPKHLEARTPMILLVELHDRPGSLCRFLETLTHVNLARIESRPVIGHPGTAFFLLDAETDSVVLSTAEWAAEQIQRLDAWPDTSSGWVVPMAPQTEARQ